MRPNISEFSYGYALTDELVHSAGYGITGVPIFPSLYQEGQAGGGYDVMLNRPSVPLFLQFKLADCMKRRSAKEARDGRLTLPCFRFHLRPKRFSDQHDLLLDLEQKGHEVYYSAPAFYQPEELNDAYLTNQVKERSVWIRPSEIGPLPDSADHHVSFQHPGQWYLYSEPRLMEGSKSFDSLAERLKTKLRAPSVGEEGQKLEKLAEDIAITAEKRQDVAGYEKSAARQQLANASAVRRIAYYASIFLEAQFVMVQLVPNDQ
jgi:hypothetical protein